MRSRQQSPAIAPPSASNPFQSFQPPPAASGFSFSMPAGTTPPPNFGASQPTQQNGFGSSQANEAPSFGGFGSNQPNNASKFGGFGSTNNSQPAQNGFNPNPSFGFSGGQTNGAASTPSTSFFGQTPGQSQQEPKMNGFGSTPSLSFGSQPSQPQQNGTSSFTFGSSQPQQEMPKPNAPSFTFGQTPQANGDKPAGTGLFGSTLAASGEAPKNGGSIFSSLQNNNNGIKPGMFTQSQANDEQTPKPANPFANMNFGQQNKEKEQEAPKASFGVEQTKQGQGSAAPKAPFSFGTSQQQVKTAEQTPAQKPLFGFGGQEEKKKLQNTPKAFSGSEEPAKPANPFGTFKFGQQQETPASKPPAQDNAAPKTNLFGSIGQPASSAPTFSLNGSQSEQTPKPTGSMFGGSAQSQSQESAAPSASFQFGASQQEDTSMASVTNTPQKPTEQQPESRAAPQTPAAGKSLFERASQQVPATAPKPSLSFGASAAPAPNVDKDSNKGKSLFERMTPRQPEPPATAPRPTMAPLGLSSTSNAAAPPLFKTPDASTQPAPQHTSADSTKVAPWSTSAPDYAKLKQLNESILAHLKAADPSKDWSVMFEYYMTEASKVMGREAFRPLPEPTQKPLSPAASSHSFNGSSNSKASSHSGGSHAMAAPPPGQSMQQPPSTPAGPSVANVFAQAAQPPATAPVNRKRSADEGLAEPPATEKRAKPSDSVEYPKLPNTASKASRLFEAALDPSTSSSKVGLADSDVHGTAPFAPAFKPNPTAKFGASAAAPHSDKPSEPGNVSDTTHSQFSPADRPQKGPHLVPYSAFAPRCSFETPQVRANPFGSESFSASAAPTSGGFKPTLGATAGGSTNFLSAFGKQAESAAEQAKRKRMDEDYDSEDEDQASWEAKDREEQEAKKRRIEEAAKSAPSFSFKPVAGAASSGSIFKLGAEQNAVEASKTPAEGKANGEIDQGSRDYSWGPSTPIKFGAPTGQESTTPAAAPPKNIFAGLFGSSATPANKGAGDELGKLAPPPVGFVFGGPKGAPSDASRTTTPGLATDGEGSGAATTDDAGDGEPADEPKDKQQEDMSKLTDAEREGHDVLLEVAIAKGSKYDDKKSENGAIVKGWVEKGKGPLYILKDQSTGKTRVLLKVGPMGRIAMNFAAKPEFKYENEAGKKTVGASFVDHLDPKQGTSGTPSRWMIMVGQPETAAKIASLLEEHKLN